MRRPCLLLVLIALAATAAPSSALADDCPGADLTPMQANLAQVADATLCLLNAERTAAGLTPVTEQADLTSASMAFSKLMVSEHFFAHVSPDGSILSERLTRAGFLGKPGSWIVGENIAWGESYLATPREIMKAWMNSQGHKENILSPAYEQIGVGIVLGVPNSDHAGATYTTDFGTRHVDGPEPAAATKGELTVGDTATAAPGSTNIRAGARSAPKAHARARRARARRACHASMSGWAAGTRKPAKHKRGRCGARAHRKHT